MDTLLDLDDDQRAALIAQCDSTIALCLDLQAQTELLLAVCGDPEPVHTFACMLEPGERAIFDTLPETVIRVHALLRPMPTVLVRTNRAVRLIPSGRVVEVIR